MKYLDESTHRTKDGENEEYSVYVEQVIVTKESSARVESRDEHSYPDIKPYGI